MAESENLEKLAADENEDVRWNAAGNPNTPASLLEKLAAETAVQNGRDRAPAITLVEPSYSLTDCRVLAKSCPRNQN